MNKEDRSAPIARRKVIPNLPRFAWTMLIFLALTDGKLRFNELQRVVKNVSQKMLTQTLRGLGDMPEALTPSTSDSSTNRSFRNSPTELNQRGIGRLKSLFPGIWRSVERSRSTLLPPFEILSGVLRRFESVSSTDGRANARTYRYASTSTL
jgi:HxlR-like helix-turn-helix